MNYHKIIYAIVLVASVTACTERLDVDYEGNSTNSLVVEGRITTDTTAHSVKITRTIDFYTEEVVPEKNAMVTISDGENLFHLSETSPGIYQTDSSVYGEIGKEYTLIINLENGEEFKASSRLNSIPVIDSISFVRETFSFTNEDFYLVYYYGWEPGSTKNSYLWNLYLNDSLFNDTIDETAFSDDELLNGQYVSEVDIYWVDEAKVPWDTVDVVLEMFSIPEDYYIFLNEVLSQTSWRGGPFDPTPANVIGNVNNGAVGYFYAAAVTRKSVTYIKSNQESEVK